MLRDWSLITGRGGLQNGKIAGVKLFAPPPPQDKVRRFAPPPPKKSLWLKFQAPMLKLPQNIVARFHHSFNFFCPPFHSPYSFLFDSTGCTFQQTTFIVQVFKIPCMYLKHLPQRVTQPSRSISYTFGKHCRPFTTLAGPSLCIKYSNPIPPTAGANGSL